MQIFYQIFFSLQCKSFHRQISVAIRILINLFYLHCKIFSSSNQCCNSDIDCISGKALVINKIIKAFGKSCLINGSSLSPVAKPHSFKRPLACSNLAYGHLFFFSIVGENTSFTHLWSQPHTATMKESGRRIEKATSRPSAPPILYLSAEIITESRYRKIQAHLYLETPAI